MKRFSARQWSLILAIAVTGGFGVAYLTFFLTQNSFPDRGLRNREHLPAKLTLCSHVDVFEEKTSIKNIKFNNVGENIYVEVSSKAEATFLIYGCANDVVKEINTMERKDAEYLRYSFNFDYFDINSISISMNAKCYVGEVNIYYLK